MDNLLPLVEILMRYRYGMLVRGQKIFSYRSHSYGLSALAWSSDGKFIASGDVNGLVQVWSSSTGKQNFAYRSHSSEVKSINWSPHGKYIASAHGNKIEVWDAS